MTALPYSRKYCSEPSPTRAAAPLTPWLTSSLVVRDMAAKSYGSERDGGPARSRKPPPPVSSGRGCSAPA
jgi:hypothetical protein